MCCCKSAENDVMQLLGSSSSKHFLQRMDDMGLAAGAATGSADDGPTLPKGVLVSKDLCFMKHFFL